MGSFDVSVRHRQRCELFYQVLKKCLHINGLSGGLFISIIYASHTLREVESNLFTHHKMRQPPKIQSTLISSDRHYLGHQAFFFNT